MDQPTPGLPTVLLFDVNETLLDLQPLEQRIDAILLESGAAKLWFSTMLHYSLVVTVSRQYRPLPEIGAATLQMMARNRNVLLNDADAKSAIEEMLTLPPHPDVRPGLEQLRKQGFRMAVLTNSSGAGVKAQLAHAGIAEFFERQFSVDSVGKFKPHADVYRWAAAEMQVPAAECMLVAAHAWDVAGAAWAGMRTAFIERAGNQLFPLAMPATICASDLNGLADQLLKSQK